MYSAFQNHPYHWFAQYVNLKFSRLTVASFESIETVNGRMLEAPVHVNPDGTGNGCASLSVIFPDEVTVVSPKLLTNERTMPKRFSVICLYMALMPSALEAANAYPELSAVFTEQLVSGIYQIHCSPLEHWPSFVQEFVK